MRISVVVVVVAALACKKNAETPPAAPANSTVQPAVAPAEAAVVAPSAGPAAVDEDKLLDVESLGGVKLRMSEVEVKAAFGLPKTKTKAHEEGATGYWVSTWAWDGIEVIMAADRAKGPSKVYALTATKPPHATARGIKVGATLEELAKAYPRSTENDDPNEFLVGSQYGGLLFTLQKDVVTSIFVGAMAF